MENFGEKLREVDEEWARLLKAESLHAKTKKFKWSKKFKDIISSE